MRAREWVGALKREKTEERFCSPADKEEFCSDIWGRDAPEDSRVPWFVTRPEEIGVICMPSRIEPSQKAFQVELALFKWRTFIIFKPQKKTSKYSIYGDIGADYKGSHNIWPPPSFLPSQEIFPVWKIMRSNDFL